MKKAMKQSNPVFGAALKKNKSTERKENDEGLRQVRMRIGGGQG